ncbi:MAG: 3-deoxy-D-manno-octulosonic acid kinase [Xanthomonadales bacterium]|nr:3-deoxy-D-manno-octulosonic acid kinase [Xanthomonadales bacterium]
MDHRDGASLVAGRVATVFDPHWFEAGTGGESGFRGGRGNVVRLQTASGELVLRQYLRGGLPRHIVRRHYLWTGAERTRAFREFRLLQALAGAGLRVPEAVAARYWRTGPVYRAALITALVPAARTLLERLEQAPTQAAELLGQVAGAVAALHARGVWHADLNATNLLFDGDDAVWLIDFDRACSDVHDRDRLAGNLDRLHRSLHKRLTGSALAAVDEAWPAVVDHWRSTLDRLSSAR